MLPKELRARKIRLLVLVSTWVEEQPPDSAILSWPKPNDHRFAVINMKTGEIERLVHPLGDGFTETYPVMSTSRLMIDRRIKRLYQTHREEIREIQEQRFQQSLIDKR